MSYRGQSETVSTTDTVPLLPCFSHYTVHMDLGENPAVQQLNTQPDFATAPLPLLAATAPLDGVLSVWPATFLEATSNQSAQSVPWQRNNLGLFPKYQEPPPASQKLVVCFHMLALSEAFILQLANEVTASLDCRPSLIGCGSWLSRTYWRGGGMFSSWQTSQVDGTLLVK